MNVNQLRKAIKVAKAESKVIYIAIHNSRFHIDFNNCKYRIDGTNELLIINDSFLGDYNHLGYSSNNVYRNKF